MKRLADKNFQLLICLILALLTIAVYLPVRNHDFVRYDDDAYVTDNRNVQSGLTLDNVKWAFTTGHASNWHPLTWLSLMLDCSIFGFKSGPMHIVNVLFHIANTLLLFIVFARMTKALWPSAFIAALFALHPLHVESVAWVAERKDVLSTLFWLLTMLNYVRYTERPSIGRYAVTLLFFGLGLMSKPMLVTLPFVLILLDYWPLHRFLNSKLVRRSHSEGGFSILNSVIEKLPFFVLAAISSIITFIVQQKGGAVPTIYSLPFYSRVANAICSYLVYIEKMFWPTRLAVLYPHPIRGISVAETLFSAIILILITVLIIYYARRYKYLVVGWLWYLGTLVPVIGIVQVGAQAWADRYTYIPLIGLFAIVAFGATDLFKTASLKKYVLSPLAIIILAGCIVATSIQLKYWKDSSSLFEHTIAVTKNNATILNNYANVLSALGKPEEARLRFIEALRILPKLESIHSNYGKTLDALGKKDEAIEQYQIALKINPDFDLARYNLGCALLQKARYDNAIEQFKIYLGKNADLPGDGVADETTSRFKQALASKPDTIRVLSHIGYCLAQKGDPNLAVLYYRQALRLDPNDIITHGRLALALSLLGQIDESIEQCRIVLAKDPNDAEMQTNLGILFESKGQTDNAVEAYKKALQIDPNSAKASDNLNAITQKQP